MRTAATYFDGQTAAAQQGTLEFHSNRLRLQLDSGEIYFDRDNSRMVPPVGEGVWLIEAINGASVHFEDQDFGNTVLPEFGLASVATRFERSWRWAIFALVAAVLSTWFLLTFGVPVAARYVAFAVPPDIEETLSSESVDILDRVMFEPSELPDESKVRVKILFEDILRESPEYANYRLEFRASAGIGANAFAIPGGVVIVTDEMVELVESDAEIIAVLAHEVGHLAQRHGLRILLQDAASAVIIAGLTGDLSNVTALSATVPTVLMQAKYSRDFEREADEFSFNYLKSRGLNPNVLAALLQRVEAESPASSPDDITSWFSSHPLTESRRPE